MTPDIFFWYVLPLIIAACAFGWIIYDRRARGPHPGE